MYTYMILLCLFILLLVMMRRIYHLCLEAVNRSGADLLMDNENISFSSVIIALLRGEIGIRFYQELDADISITWKAYQSASTSHPPLTEDWKAVTEAALSSTRQLLQCRDPDEVTPLHVFIHSVVLSTFLYLFFHLPITPMNTEVVMWIASKTWRTDDHQQDTMLFPELSRLIKSSQNPSGVFALLSTTRRLLLATACTLESRGKKIHFLRRAETLLRDPISPEPGVTRLVERAMRSNPPVQFVRGGFPLGPFAFYGTNEMEILIPIDLVSGSACILGSDGGCISWLHKAALPSKTECGGEQWLVRTATIILSAIETELRQACLIIDENERGSEEWEEWIVRRLRV